MGATLPAIGKDRLRTSLRKLKTANDVSKSYD
jgi:hypothetical protein